ncbi:MAG: phosphomethylpyrimidine synthase, partial [Chlorobium sp.]|nr:phosphomethylpyrimidine synthase [Chlorobium sp.]
MSTSPDNLFCPEQNFYGPDSEKIYIDGSLHPVKVGMRRIKLSKTYTLDGADFSYFPLYDTSGPYSDPSVTI